MYFLLKYVHLKNTHTWKVRKKNEEIDIIQAIWEKMFPHNRLIRKSGFIELVSTGRDSNSYTAGRMSDSSAAIVVERREEGHALPIQRPVYFISEVLSETKAHYPQIQKLLYAVILTRQKLRHYFVSHLVTVVSSFPLGEIIQCCEASGRIAKWAVELMGHLFCRFQYPCHQDG